MRKVPLNSELVRELMHLPPETMIFLDYDGTLVELSPDPDRTFPDDDLLNLLDAVSKRYETFIATGRSLAEITRFLDDRYNLIALHGAILRKRGSNPVALTDLSRYISICNYIYSNRDAYFVRYPGLKITNKDGGIVFILWSLEPESAARLSQEVAELAAKYQMDLYRGKRIIELRVPGVNKGMTIARVRGDRPAVIAGDDATDEDSFLANHNAITIKIGDGTTSAKYHVTDVRQFREVLRLMASQIPETS